MTPLRFYHTVSIVPQISDVAHGPFRVLSKTNCIDWFWLQDYLVNSLTMHALKCDLCVHRIECVKISYHFDSISKAASLIRSNTRVFFLLWWFSTEFWHNFSNFWNPPPHSVFRTMFYFCASLPRRLMKRTCLLIELYYISK